ncbi:hypothetical protein BDQ12DRAFT_775062 [Crucibulum laeve]|uniref:Uncharacterized protein n=1 Tax=Crucibulum laeve TaxID=68775 RepID=A0A5C3LHG5_9AGAR|nr:hypothetical protein BDQ12DRAFT_775062 [Crucibulum laeve]
MMGHRIILLGHSAGVYFPINDLPCVSRFLIEFTMVAKGLWNTHLDERMVVLDLSVAAASVRRSEWSLQEEALKYSSNRIP